MKTSFAPPTRKSSIVNFLTVAVSAAICHFTSLVFIGFLFGNPKEIDHLEVLGIEGRIILF
jgi:hypothetical protein